MKRLVTRAALLLAVSASVQSVFATDYFVNSSAGSGGNGSANSPFNSLSDANALDFNAGDHLYLKGAFNATTGGLILGSDDSGTASKPVTITSWGKTPATINAGDRFGIRAIDVGGVSISNLNVVGSGAGSRDSSGLFTNTDSGIRFYNDSGKQDYVRINKVNVSGFGENGIFIQGGSNQSGFNDVKITNSTVSQNQRAGLSIAADFDSADRNAHTNVTIDHVKAHDNYGRANRPDEGNSGNGIVIGQVNGGVIQHSTAWGNGTADASEDGGSVGIWAWDSNKIKIQFNESYKNGTAGEHDGGGFDLDGGVTNSVMQHNYSHDNAGAGYLLAEFKNARNFADNEVANNISVDDARKNGYGALHAFGAIDSASVHDNTVYLSPADKDQDNTRDEAPAGIKLRGSQDKDIDFSDNLFILRSDGSDDAYQPEKFANTGDASGYTLNGNDYRAITGDASDPDAVKLEALLDQLGGDLSSGKIVAIDADALDAYLRKNEPIDATDVTVSDPVVSVGSVDSSKDLVDVNKDIVKEVLQPPTTSVVTPPSAVGSSGTAIPEPSTIGILSLASAALLRRRRRAN